MWSGRFREPLDSRFEEWQRSFPFDWRLLPFEIDASAAHARALEDAGALSYSELALIQRGLEEVRRGETVGMAVVESTPDAEDIHHYVEMQLTKFIGTLGLKLHTGRSRNEQIATDLRLFVRGSIDKATEYLHRWATALVDQAEAAGDAVMPSYTHLQRAEPVLVAHWLLAYVSMVERDLSRLTDCRARLNWCPLGSGAVAGATLALDRKIMADALAFYGPTSNSMDATSDRDFVLEFAQIALQTGLHLSRFAEELTLYATAEFGFIDLPERFSTGSSAMPQKKNPDLTELVRGKTGRLVGGTSALAVILKSLPLAYNKDMQETQEAVFDVADTLLGMLGLMAPFTEALGFRWGRMEEAASTGYLNAMAAATYLVHKGVAFRTAHEKVGHAVRLAIDRGVELNDLPLSELKQFGEEFEEDFFEAISLQATVDCHDVEGGTGRAHVRSALRAARERFPRREVVEGVDGD